MAKEYIEREAALKIIYDKWFASCSRISNSIRELPTADVVEVVRCKYCEHYRPYPKPVEDFDGRCWIRGHETDEMEFCSYGVKKERKETPVKKDAPPTDKTRCRKCVYEMTCFRDRDFKGTCPDYKRDAPDGGYYG